MLMHGVLPGGAGVSSAAVHGPKTPVHALGCLGAGSVMPLVPHGPTVLPGVRRREASVATPSTGPGGVLACDAWPKALDGQHPALGPPTPSPTPPGTRGGDALEWSMNTTLLCAGMKPAAWRWRAVRPAT